MTIYRVSSEGEKSWTEVEAASVDEANTKFKQKTGREAAQTLAKPQGWGNIR